jgi:hypothetical protein
MADYNKRHWQHTKQFEQELNAPKKSYEQPFRISDGIMKVGKYKGQHISVIPVTYKYWLLNEWWGLSYSHKKILNETL